MKTLDAEMRNAIRDYDGGMHRAIDPLWLGEQGSDQLATPEMAGMQTFDTSRVGMNAVEDPIGDKYKLDSPIKGDSLSPVDYSSSVARRVQGIDR